MKASPTSQVCASLASLSTTYWKSSSPASRPSRSSLSSASIRTASALLAGSCSACFIAAVLCEMSLRNCVRERGDTHVEELRQLQLQRTGADGGVEALQRGGQSVVISHRFAHIWMALSMYPSLASRRAHSCVGEGAKDYDEDGGTRSGLTDGVRVALAHRRSLLARVQIGHFVPLERRRGGLGGRLETRFRFHRRHAVAETLEETHVLEERLGVALEWRRRRDATARSSTRQRSDTMEISQGYMR